MGCGGSTPNKSSSPEYEEHGVDDEAQYGQSSSHDVTLAHGARDAYDGQFHGFIEFPTPHLLQEANKLYTKIVPKPRVKNREELPAYPLPTAKEDVFQLDKFEAVDNYALQAPKSLLNGSLPALVKHLMQGAKGDVAKVRALFRWITCQDLNNVQAQSKSNAETVEQFLCGLKEGYLDHTDLLLMMCGYANIYGKKIIGYGKSSEYKVGERNNLEQFPVTWAAVLVDGVWRLVNPAWGSCTVDEYDSEWLLLGDDGNPVEVEKKEETNKFRYTCENFFFFPNPEEYIYQVIPRKEDRCWQLLARPVTEEEFDDLVYVREGFFEIGLKVRSHPKCNIYTKGGHVDIEFGIPTKVDLSFYYTLWVSTSKEQQTTRFGDNELSRYVLLSQSQGTLRCSLDFPIAGKFMFQLSGNVNNWGDKDADTIEPKWLCSYIIHCEEPKQDCNPLPQIEGSEWGPTAALDKLGMQAVTHQDALVEAEDGEAQLVFRTKNTVDISHKLHSNTLSPEQLEKYVIHRKENGRVILDVKLPESGQYALNISAKDSKSADPSSHVCTYLVTSDKKAFDPTPFPSIPGMSCGESDNNDKLELKLVSHETPLITAPETGEMDMVFKNPVPCDLETKLTLQTSKGEETVNGCHLMTQKQGESKFSLQFPKAGNYKFEVNGRPEGDSVAYSNVYNSIIKVPTPKVDISLFPTTSKYWGKGCELIGPTSGELQPNTQKQFQVRIDGADSVAVRDKDNNLTYLTKNEKGIWVGDVNTGDAGHELTLVARFPSKGTDHKPLLTFKVVSAEHINEAEQMKEAMRKKVAEQNRKEKEEKRKREESFMKVKNDLQQAMNNRNLKDLQKALNLVEKHGFRTRLEKEVAEAKKLLVSLERLERLRKTILDLDTATMAEVRGYNNPPPLVHDAMVATLLLLGEQESITRDWDECRKRCNTIGQTSLYRRVNGLDVHTLHPEIVARARQILQKCPSGEIFLLSAAAGAFYTWCVGIIEEVQTLQKAAKNARPADARRQKELFEKQKNKAKK